jgi:phosphohistidine phosphatase SixA
VKKNLLGLVSVIVALWFCHSTATSQAGEKNSLTTIILVRHAEKDTMKTDPPLSATGWNRARLYARMFKDSGVRSTHSTQFRRTITTMQPLDSLLSITNEVIPVDRDSIEQHSVFVAKHFLSDHNGETVIMAGHSNVIPSIIKALGIETEVTIDESDYTNAFIVTAGPNVKSTMVRLRIE